MARSAFGSSSPWSPPVCGGGFRGSNPSQPLPVAARIGRRRTYPGFCDPSTGLISESVRNFARTLDLKTIVGVHITRIIGLDFLFQYSQGRLPAGFAFPAGLGDILVGVTAVPLVLAISRDLPGVRKWFVAWNVLGIMDLVVAVGSGILHFLSALGVLAGTGPTTLLMNQFPRSMVPTFLVPVFILLHLLALARRNEVRSGSAGTHHEGLAARA